MPLPLPEEISTFCRRVLDDPERGEADFLRIARAGSPPEVIERLTCLLPDAADPDLALAHLERYCREGPLPADPDSLQALVGLFGVSPYLAEALITDRGYLPHLLRARRHGSWGPEEYRDELARWMRITHGEDPWDALRAFKRRTTLRIALRDIQGLAGLAEVGRELSCAADALIGCGLDLALARGVDRFGRPQAFDESGRTVQATLAVLALGKLGGMELNYSSDIDLLFLYSADGETTGAAGRSGSQVTNKEYFTGVAEHLARGLGQISVEGQVFRVDCGLRPGGRDGDLVVPLQAALVYYRTWARQWERQALIKARPCAGDAGLGARFLGEMASVIYTDPPDPALAEGIRQMKDRIDGHLARRGEAERHVKLGRGGIREIEFTVQALQRTHGGRSTWIREPNTLLALHRLADKGYLPAGEHGALSAAYVFLRTVEHRLQIHRNLQRSSLPSGPRELRALARALGYRDGTHRQEAAPFLADLEAHRGAVRQAYDGALSRLSQATLAEAPAPDPFLDPVTDAETAAILAEAGLRDPESLLGSVTSIARLLASHGASPDLRRAIRLLTPQLLRDLRGVGQPVRALRNFERYLEALGLQPRQLALLASRRELIAPLLRLFGGSQLLSSILLHRPELPLAEGFGEAVARDRTMEEHLARLMRRADAADPAAAPDAGEFAAWLRRYQRGQILYIGLKDINRQSGPAGIGRALSDLAEAIVQASLATAASLCGWPVTADPAGAAALRTPGFIVLGLGKLGYRELDFTSDLDLVFAYDPRGGDPAQRHAAANRLAAATVEMLTSITREGALYSVDARLRPFGRQGELAQSIPSLKRYFESDASVWELQSFLKARALAGDPPLARETVAALETVVLARASKRDPSHDVREMKLRLQREAGKDSPPGGLDVKRAAGGLSTIQFLIQLLQLRHGIPSPDHKRTSRLLAALQSSGVLGDEDHAALYTGFQFLRRLEHQLRLIHGRPVSRLPTSREALEEIAQAMGYEDRPGMTARDALVRATRDCLERNEAIWSRVVERTAGSRSAPR